MNLLKSRNPEKEYPSNTGVLWTNKEEFLLLEELSKNMDIEIIAQTHNRTTGGINARRKELAYKMHIANDTIEEIMDKTKLKKDQIIEFIHKKQNKSEKCKSIIESKKPYSIENEITEMKNDIKELKHTTKELLEMMKAVYDFEDV
jgi:DNA-binding transcriptional regulator YhcF (GntR family)